MSLGISPKIAAELADGIYAVQNELFLKIFMAKKFFSGDPREKVPIKAEVGSRLINTRDGFGVCARGGKGYEKDIFLIFRGTTMANYGADWVSNARIGVEMSNTGLPVHIGFNHIFSSMLPQIKTFLAGQKGDITVHCIGHSLGGAVATLAADWIKNHKAWAVKLYTFGAPKPGFEMFSRKLTTKLGAANIYRVYHSTDPVPMIPLYPFVHAPVPGNGYHLLSSESLLSAEAEAHSMGRYIKSVGTSDWLAVGDPQPLSNNQKLVEHWLASDRSVNPFNPKTWDWINAGLQFVLKKVMAGSAAILQSLFVGGLTLADKVAWLLREGIDATKEAGEWVFRIMRKIIQALGIAVVDSVTELTRVFMRQILERLMQKINQEAVRAIRVLTRQ